VKRSAAAVTVVVLALLWLALGVTAAAAHALMSSSVPADGATLQKAPPAVSLRFTEPPDPTVSIVHVLDATGAQVDTAKPQAVPGDQFALRLPLPTLSNGVYTVTWRTVSKTDGHVTGGAFAFGVGTTPTGPVTTGQGATPGTPPPSPLAVAGRWVLYLGLVVLAGAAAVGLLVDRVVPSVPRFRTFLLAAWAVSVLGLILLAIAERSTVGVPLRQFLDSSAGRELLEQLLALVVVGITVGLMVAMPSATSLATVAIATAAAMFVHVLGGHANAPAPTHGLNLAIQWLHVLAVGVWVGGLAWFLLLLRSADRMDPVVTDRGRAAVRFSLMATVSLAVVAATGLLRAIDLVGGPGEWRRLVDTSFGVTLVIKVALFAGLVALGARNRFVNVPRLARGESGPRPLRTVVTAEVLVAAGVLGVTAVLTGLPPAATAARAAKPSAPAQIAANGHDFGTTTRARLVVTPGAVGPNRFTVTVADFDTGRAVAADAVTLRFDARDQPSVGETTLQLTRERRGVWSGSGPNLSLDAVWNVTMVVQQPANAIDVPLVLTPRPPPEHLQVQAAPGQPTLYTVTFAGGSQVQMYVDPAKEGTNQVHATYFDAQGAELPVASATFSARDASGRIQALEASRFSAGHFVGQGTLSAGTWHLIVQATTRTGTPLAAYFDQRIAP
jgi:copper transport protein